MSFAAEPYGVFVDDLVSALTGGITREELVFLPENAPFRLGRPADYLTGTARVHGLVEELWFRFTEDTDFKIEVGGVITWLEASPGVPRAGATWPDRGSRFYVSYERTPTSQPAPRLTDRNPGSVLRVLAESFAREYAVVSKQLDLVHKAAFLATAEGRDLDQVVALVGLPRRTRLFAAGEVIFSRATPAPADITIRAGTLVSTGEVPAITVETTEDRTLRAGTVSVAAPVQSQVAGPKGVASAGALSVVHRPILGIEAVTNPQPLVFGGGDETDAALRSRAKRALEVGGRATVEALVGALTSIDGIREQDVLVSEDHLAFPGVVKLSIAADLDAAASQRAADLITEYRPAGIKVLHNLVVTPPASVPVSTAPGGSGGGPVTGGGGGASGGPSPGSAPSVWFDVGVTAAVTPASASLTAAQKATLQGKVQDALLTIVAGAGIGAPLIYNRLVSAAMAVDGVFDVSLDLYTAGATPRTGRSNLVPSPSSTRPRLQAANLAVTLRGSLLALDVTSNVQLLNLAAAGDHATGLAGAAQDITARLNDALAQKMAALAPGASLAIRPDMLKAVLTDTLTYHVVDVSYAAEFVEDGLRVTRNNVELDIPADQQPWIRAVHAVEGTIA